MLIGHLPASYLWTRALQRWRNEPRWLWLGLLAGMLPDLDLLYFFLVDERQHLHHTYWTHLPFAWLVAGGMLAALLSALPSRGLRSAASIFFSNILLHLLLDSLSGGIAWLYPASDNLWRLVEVPARPGFWVWSFVLHWTFLPELLLLALAGWALWSERRQRATAAAWRDADPPAADGSLITL
jgi:inner membrane protein